MSSMPRPLLDPREHRSRVGCCRAPKKTRRQWRGGEGEPANEFILGGARLEADGRAYRLPTPSPSNPFPRERDVAARNGEPLSPSPLPWIISLTPSRRPTSQRRIFFLPAAATRFSDRRSCSSTREGFRPLIGFLPSFSLSFSLPFFFLFLLPYASLGHSYLTLPYHVSSLRALFTLLDFPGRIASNLSLSKG
jgi:hypothetical protein